MEDDTDEGPDRSAVMRRCIATREVRSISELIRFVQGPDGAVVPDIKAKLPGRGVWVSNSRAVLETAIAKNLFPRAFKSKASAMEGLADQVSSLLKRDALQMLSLANKAGALTTGFAKIEGSRGPILCLVQASDGSAAEIARLQTQCRGRGPGRRDPEAIRVFDSRELALSIGREHVIHAALTVHDAASAFRDRALRFAEFEAASPAKPDAVSASGLSGFPVSRDGE
ncbi:MAG TPA: RNA-binding protein [Rhabdaerophilum sp.]|nr:RNA-binding protein [Rhabdaerophilum sp.]